MLQTLLLIFIVTSEVYSNNCEVRQNCPSISADQDETSLTFLPIPSDCAKFIQCDRGYPYIVDCPSGLHFNRILNVCDWPASANCEPCINAVSNVEHSELSFKNNAELSSSVCDNADAYNYLFPFPSDCAKFISCSNGIPYEMICPDDLHFNNELKVCDFPTFAKCNIVTKATATLSTTSSTATTLGDESTTSADVCAQATAHKYLFPFPTDCTKFISCSNGVPYTMHCPADLHFNSRINACDYASSARCTISTTSTIITTTETSIFTTEVVTSTAEIETIATETGTISEYVENTTTSEETDVMSSPILRETKSPCPEDSFLHNVLLPVINDCDKFISCENGVPLVMNCPKGLHFSVEISLCDWPHLANCTVGTVTPTTTIDDIQTFELISTTTGGAPEKTTIDIGTEPATTPTTSIAPATTNVEGSTTDELTMLPGSVVDQNTTVTASIIDDATEVSTSTFEETAIPDVSTTEETTTEDVSQSETTTKTTVSSINDTITFDDIPTTLELTTTPGEAANSSTQPIISENATEADTTSTADTNFTSTPDPEVFKSICPVESFTHHVLLPVDGDCSKFISCENGAHYLMDCPRGLHFNLEISLCDWPHLANCTVKQTTAASTTVSSEFISLESNTTIEVETEPATISTSVNDTTTDDLTSTMVRTTSNAIGDTSTFATSDTSPETQTVTTSDPEVSKSICPVESFSHHVLLPVKGDCGKFILCENGAPYLMDCPTGLHFNIEISLCDWPHLANCSLVTTTDAAITTIDDTMSEELTTITLEPNTTTEAQTEPVITSTTANVTTSDELISTTISTTGNAIEDSSTFADTFIDDVAQVSTTMFDTLTGPQTATTVEGTTAEEATIIDASYPKAITQITVSPTNVTTTSDPEVSKFICPVESFSHHVLLPVKGDCGKFILCENGAPYLMDCPTGLHFNIEISLCDWPHLANCSLVTTIVDLPSTNRVSEEFEFQCPVASFAHFVLLPVANDCGKLISCQYGVAHEMSCPKGLHFNVGANYCDWPYLANCTLYENITEVVSDITTTHVPEELESPCLMDSFSHYGLLPVKDDCGKFISCENGIPHKMNCPAGLHFNVERKLCDWPHLANCTTEATTTVGDTTTEAVPTSEFINITSINVIEPSITTSEGTTTTPVGIITIVEVQSTTTEVTIDSSTATSDSEPTTVEDTTTEIVKVTSNTSTDGSDKLTTTDALIDEAVSFVATRTEEVPTTITVQTNESSWETTAITETSSTTSEATTTTSEAAIVGVTTPNAEGIITTEKVSTTAADVTASVEVQTAATQAAIDSSTSTSEPKSTTTEDTTTEGLNKLTTTDAPIDETTKLLSTRSEEVSTKTSTAEEFTEMSSTTSEATTTTYKDATTTNEEIIFTTEEYSTTAAVETTSGEVPTTTTQVVTDKSPATELNVNSTTSIDGSDKLTTTDVLIDEAISFVGTRTKEVPTTTTVQTNESSWETTTITDISSTTSEATTTTSEATTEDITTPNAEGIITTDVVSTTAIAVTVEVPTTATQAAIDSSTSPSEPKTTTKEDTTTEVVYETSSTTTEGLNKLTTTDVPIDETTMFPSTRSEEVSTTTSTTSEVTEMSSTTSEATTTTYKDVEVATTTQVVIDSTTAIEPEPTRLEDTTTESDELTTMDVLIDETTTLATTVTTTKHIGDSSWNTTTVLPVISISEAITNPTIVTTTTVKKEITTMVPNEASKIPNEPTGGEPEPTTVQDQIYTTLS